MSELEAVAWLVCSFAGSLAGYGVAEWHRLRRAAADAGVTVPGLRPSLASPDCVCGYPGRRCPVHEGQG